MNKNSTVSIINCKEYDDAKILKALREVLSPLGGIEAFVNAGDRVLLKPNLLSDATPDKNVTTHPTIVKAVVKLVQEAGATPVIGDDPGMSNLDKAAAAAGITDVAKETGAELLPFKTSVPIQGENLAFKNIEIAKEVLDCDKIINLAKLKTHVQMVITLGIKNTFGCVVGKRKSQWHLMAGKDTRYFARMIVDVFAAVKPTLTIMDGIMAMHKDGPQNGETYPMGLLYASSDTIALDATITTQVGLPYEKNEILLEAIERGLGEGDISRINYPGVHPKSVMKKDFETPTQIDLEIGPKFLRPFLRKQLVPKPKVEHSTCTLCVKCRDVCPPDVIKIINKKIHIDQDGCIHCFCCVEMCPEGSMQVHRSFLSKLLASR